MKFVRIDFRPDGKDKESVKGNKIEEMEAKGYAFLQEVAIIFYSSILVFVKKEA